MASTWYSSMSSGSVIHYTNWNNMVDTIWCQGGISGSYVGHSSNTTTAHGLDSYAGNTSLVTLGTVTTGTWNGTAVDSNYITLASGEQYHSAYMSGSKYTNAYLSGHYYTRAYQSAQIASYGTSDVDMSNLIASTNAITRFADSSSIQTKFLLSGETLNAISANRIWAGTGYISAQTGIYAYFISAENTNLTGTGISDIVEDTTPQLGGDLDANLKSIYNATSISSSSISGGSIITNSIGIGTINPSASIHIRYGYAQGLPVLGTDANKGLLIQNNTDGTSIASMTLIGGDGADAGGGAAKIQFGDNGNDDQGYITYENATNSFKIGANHGTRLVLSGSKLYVGGSNTASYPLQVNGSTYSTAYSGGVYGDDADHIFKKAGNQIFKINQEANAYNHTNLYGSDDTGEFLYIYANTKDGYPKIQLQGSGGTYIWLKSGAASRGLYIADDLRGQLIRIHATGGTTDTTNKIIGVGTADRLFIGGANKSSPYILIGKNEASEGIEYNAEGDHIFKVDGNNRFKIDDVYISTSTGLYADWISGNNSNLSMAPGGSEGQIQYNNTTMGGADALYWDDTTNRLGVGTANPSAAVHIASGTAEGLTGLAGRQTGLLIQSNEDASKKAYITLIGGDGAGGGAGGGSIEFGDSDSISQGSITYANADDEMNFSADNVNSMNLAKQKLYVGGAVTPNYTLHVGGTTHSVVYSGGVYGDETNHIFKVDGNDRFKIDNTYISTSTGLYAYWISTNSNGMISSFDGESNKIAVVKSSEDKIVFRDIVCTKTDVVVANNSVVMA